MNRIPLSSFASIWASCCSSGRSCPAPLFFPSTIGSHGMRGSVKSNAVVVPFATKSSEPCSELQ